MSRLKDIYILKPQRCFVTLSGQVLNLYVTETSKVAVADEGYGPKNTIRKKPELRLFHHTV